MKISDYIRLYPNIIPKDVCDHIIQSFEVNNKHVDYKSILNDKMKFESLNISALENFKEIEKIFFQTVKQLFHDYKKSLDLSVEQMPDSYGVEEIRIKKYYKSDGYFKRHVDVRDYDSAKRFLGCFAYLNDCDGGTRFYTQEEEFIVPAKTGTMVMFPPLWMFPHEGVMPTNNNKYFIGTYLHYV